MFIINKRMILFEIFVVILFFCQFRLAQKQGYILLFLEIIIGFIYWIWNKRKIRMLSYPALIYFLFIIYRIVLSLLVSGGMVDNIKTILYKELGMFLLCVLLVQGCSRLPIIKRIRDFGVVVSILGCYELVTHSSIFLPYITVESRIYIQTLGTAKTRVQTIFMHPTICGVFMIITWFCVLFIPYKKNWKNYLSKFFVFLCLLGTQSRSCWIAFFVVNVLYMWKNYKTNKIYLNKNHFFHICIFLIFTVILAFIFREYIIKVFQTVVKRWLDGMDSNNAGNYNRVTMIKMGLHEWGNLDILRKIFGAGNGYAYQLLLSNPIRGWRGAVDNQYLTVLLDFGLVGFFLLIFLAGYIFIKTIRSSDSTYQFFGLCLLSMFISGFFYEMFSWITVTLLFCLFISILEQKIILCNMERDNI
ncbi:MAG: O-antigen ligase family protein [Lachnospiraceae bacterium]|nr:O-antigen ligase family protein [Lachnospiraceae bacterium]